MSYYEVYSKYKDFEYGEIEKTIPCEETDVREFARLLSPAAEESLEEMAQESHDITLRYFGRTIQLYTPMYLSNYCDNSCVYCGFNSNNAIERRKLSLEETREEAVLIASTGLRHILILTGESREESPISYIKECVEVLRDYFSSIAIEVYPLREEEYKELISAGVDGLTIYQETYDEGLYAALHGSGPKRDYLFRLDAPERGARAGMRAINIGALLGLSDWRKDIFFTCLHAKYLQDKFPDIEIGISIPRIRQQVSGFKAPHPVSDQNIVQAITALRLFMPRIGITVSTREEALFREHLVGLGITRISAGSTTCVGARIDALHKCEGVSQFEILDKRGVEEIKRMLESKNYQPVLKDWTNLL
jgi:2-iminoacetate synthase